MATPAFTAEASMYRTGSRFARTYAPPTSATGIVPQDHCGACTCDAAQCCHSNSAGCWCGSCHPHYKEAIASR